MQITLRTKYINETAVLTFGHYQDGALAITFASPQGEPLAKATSCLAEFGYTPPEGSIAVKNYSENVGMLDCLIQQGVVEAEYDTFDGPFGAWPICKLTAATIEAATDAAING